MNAPSPHPAVLVVDDEAMVLVTLRAILEREGYKVSTCSSAADALQLMRREEFGVVISDHRMPNMMGLDFLKECRRMRPECSRILLTAVLHLKEVMEAIASGEICRFISKPWLREELLAAVTDASQRHELTARNAALVAETQRLQRLLDESRVGVA
ncbi:MAG TPA: response regulator [Opitutaceae bacterium]|jgi:DNA-binding NtrC family response regulator